MRLPLTTNCNCAVCVSGNWVGRNVTMGPAVGREGKCLDADCSCDALTSPCPSCCHGGGGGAGNHSSSLKCKPGTKLGCYAVTKAQRDKTEAPLPSSSPPLLPVAHEELHDHVTLEDCAAACATSNLTVAGISGGNHCSCGAPGALTTAAAKAQQRPIEECLPKNCTMAYGDGCACTGDPSERCGAPERLLAYEFTCTE